MLRKTSEAIVLCQLLLDEIFPKLETMQNVSIIVARDVIGNYDAFDPKALQTPPGNLCLDSYICGTYRCLLGWMVEWPEFRQFLHTDSCGELDWFGAGMEIIRRLGFPNPPMARERLFGDSFVGGSLSRRRAYLERHMAELLEAA